MAQSPAIASILFGALLLSASSVSAQYNTYKNCIKNKESEIQWRERKYKTAYQEVLKPENMVAIAWQMEEAGHLSKDLSQSEKNGIAHKLITDQLTQMKKQIEIIKTLPDCSTVQGVQQP